MLGFLIFYYCFSVLFMIGYVDFDELDGFWCCVLGIAALFIFAPLVFPFNLGAVIGKIDK